MTADKRAGTRNAYYRERREKQKAALAAAEAAQAPIAGGKLTETILVRLSQRAIAEIDKRRKDGLFELSRSEFMRKAVEAYLTRGR